jgi:hypothetical protein
MPPAAILYKKKHPNPDKPENTKFEYRTVFKPTAAISQLNA